jgi:hypothetical protein
LKNKDPRAKYLQKLIQNPLGLDATFSFSCKACGNCCRNRDDVLLSAFDLYRISKHLNIKPKEAFEKYCETYIGPTSNLPIVRLRPKPIPNMLLRVPEPYSSACPLLENGRCSVHKAKPITCALFPIGRGYDPQAKKVFYVLNDAKCNDGGKRHVIKDWLAFFDIPLHDEAYIAWTEFLTESVKFMQKFLKASDRLKEMIWNCFFLIMYLTYDTNDEFLPQLKRNIKEFKDLMSKARS